MQSKAKQQLIAKIREIDSSKQTSLDKIKQLIELAERYELELANPKSQAVLNAKKRLEEVHQQLNLLNMKLQLEQLKKGGK